MTVSPACGTAAPVTISSAIGARPGAATETVRPETAATVGGDEVHARRTEEAGDEPVGGAVVELERRADLLDLAVIEDHDPARHRHGFGLVVRHVDHRRLELGMQPPELDPHLRAQRRIEVGQRFVEQEDVGRSR